MHFMMCSFYFCKRCHWDFDRYRAGSVGCFGESCHFNIEHSLQSMKIGCVSTYLCL